MLDFHSVLSRHSVVVTWLNGERRVGPNLPVSFKMVEVRNCPKPLPHLRATEMQKNTVLSFVHMLFLSSFRDVEPSVSANMKSSYFSVNVVVNCLRIHRQRQRKIIYFISEGNIQGWYARQIFLSSTQEVIM